MIHQTLDNIEAGNYDFEVENIVAITDDNKIIIESEDSTYTKIGLMIKCVYGTNKQHTMHFVYYNDNPLWIIPQSYSDGWELTNSLVNYSQCVINKLRYTIYEYVSKLDENNR